MSKAITRSRRRRWRFLRASVGKRFERILLRPMGPRPCRDRDPIDSLLALGEVRAFEIAELPRSGDGLVAKEPAAQSQSNLASRRIQFRVRGHDGHGTAIGIVNAADE